MKVKELVKLAAEAYIYGYPMVYTIDEQLRHVEGKGRPDGPARPVNIMGFTDKLLGPENKFVSPNNDTLYLALDADVTQEPLVLHVPDTNDRYYVLQFIDAWTNNFAYIGRRATGTQEGFFLLAGPDWQGEVPDGMRLVRAPTNIFHVVGRYAVADEADILATRVLMEDTWVTPLSRYPEQADNSQREFGDWDLAPYNPDVRKKLIWWEKFRAWSQLFPPSAEEREYLQKFEPLGLLDQESPYLKPRPGLSKLLQTAQKKGQEFIETTSKGGGEKVNGWAVITHVFDFNLDFFEVGTIDAPEWKIADRTKARGARAVAAHLGLWGNHAYEAAYALVWTDEHGEQLNGTHRYVLHFDEVPPADAFWSLTMYDAQDFYLVANPINRYSIGNRTPGIQYNADGSLDLYLQHASPGPEKESNWLPAPAGDFRPTLRMYQPGPSVFDGSWLPPAIKRLD
jgi:hypothetical protein